MSRVHKGFFQTQDLPPSRISLTLVPKCGACGLSKKCESPKMEPSGKGKRRILIVGEAPGRDEDQNGIQFCGKTGTFLEETLDKLDVTMRKDCWITNAVICRPPGNKLPKNTVEYCRPTLVKTITDLDPDIIIPLGAKAVQSLIGWVWREDVGSIARWEGWRIPCQKLNAWICPTWHPSHILRHDYGSQKHNEVREMFFERHLKRAFALEGKPFAKVPPEPDVKIIYDDNEAYEQIQYFMDSKVPVAFDYETDRLKPDPANSMIYSCSMSDGEKTIAFPWGRRAKKAMRKFLRTPIPKIASNLKFEERWTLKEFGEGVNGWFWDTMIAAHVIDNRPDISGVKFQAFVLLGADSWDSEIKKFLRAKGSNTQNRIREAPLAKLLLYNGIDSFREVQVAEEQRRILRML